MKDLETDVLHALAKITRLLEIIVFELQRERRLQKALRELQGRHIDEFNELWEAGSG